MGGGGGRINKPKSSKVSVRKRTRDKTRRTHKREHTRSEDTLSSTTEHVLRQCRYLLARLATIPWLDLFGSNIQLCAPV